MTRALPRSLARAPFALAALCVFHAAPAFAQPAGPDAAASAAGGDTTLPVVRVRSGRDDGATEGRGSYKAEAATSATRMNLSPRETPQSVSVVTREQMNDHRLTDIASVLERSTGIAVQQFDSERTVYYARGFEIKNFQIDHMPRGGNAPLEDTLFYDRVEIVRGAAGLLGGTGDPSATINSIRKKPTRELKGSASVELGRWDRRRVEADVSSALTQDGRIRGRVAAGYQERDSFIRNYHERKDMGMAVIEADLTDRTLLSAGIDWQENKPSWATWGAVPYWNADGSLANLPRDFSLSVPWGRWQNEQSTLFTSLDHRFDGGWSARVGLSRTTSKNKISIAYGGSGYPDPATGGGMSLWTGVWGESVEKRDMLDLYTTGPFELLGRRHTLIAGWNSSWSSNKTPGGSATPGYPAQIPDYRDWDGNIPEPVFVPDGTSTDQHTNLGGGYLAARFSLADPLHVIVGARLSNYSTYTRQYGTEGGYTGTTDTATTRREITPYLGAVYDIDNTWSAYTSWTSVFQPQTARDRDNQFLAPETGTATEAGVKAEFFDGQLNASAAVFQVEKKNLAELDPSVPAGFKLPDGSDAYVANADGITARGIELEVSGEVASGWNLAAGYTFLRAREANGEHAATNQPRHLLRASTAYRFGGALQGLKAGGAVKAQSAIYSMSWSDRPGTGESAPIVQRRYAVVDAFTSYDVSRHLTLRLNVTNLFDKHYYRNVGFYDGVFWGEPRNVRVSATATF